MENTSSQAKAEFSFDHTKLVTGAKFYEDIYGYLIRFEVEKPAVVSRNNDGKLQCTWTAKGNDHTGPTVFLVTEGYEHYGPRIYLEDEIVEINGRFFSTR